MNLNIKYDELVNELISVLVLIRDLEIYKIKNSNEYVMLLDKIIEEYDL